MREFVDLNGASGAAYRFRVWPSGEPHPSIGGNFAFLREEAGGFSVLDVGETQNLSSVEGQWDAAKGAGATGLFTRLNVSAAVRVREHRDIAAYYSLGVEAAPEAGADAPAFKD